MPLSLIQSVGLTPVEEELRGFDDHMNHARGLAPKTRKHYVAIIRRLLFGQFADQPVMISALKPDDIGKFVASPKRGFVRYLPV